MSIGTLTVLFTDLVRSTELLAELGDVAGTELLVDHLTRLREVVYAHEGKEVKPTGDGLMVVFHSALKAVECAVAMQQRIRWDNDEIQMPIGLRIGIDAGEAEARGGDYYGTWVVAAKRLCDAAEGGQILVSPVVRSLSGSLASNRFRELSSMRLKGVTAPVAPSEVLWEPVADLPPTSDAKILAVDDQKANLLLVEQLLERSGFPNVKGTSDAREALPLFLEFRPDLVLLDLQMPHVDGYEVLEQIQAHIPGDDYLPVLILTADISAEAKKRCLAMGAKDFLTKPFDQTEILLRIKNLLETRSLHLAARAENRRLELRSSDRNEELERAEAEAWERLARTADLRETAAGQHARGVGDLAHEIALASGSSAAEADLLGRAARLHDIGKVGVSDAILSKPGPLSEDERRSVKAHTVIGAELLSGGTSRLLSLAEEIALTHHERWDGSGYAGLKEESIPMSGRITAIAEVLDTLLHERPYKKAWPEEEALAEIHAGRGTLFDPHLVSSFLSYREEALGG
jgi:putative two-component system response regulator